MDDNLANNVTDSSLVSECPVTAAPEQANEVRKHVKHGGMGFKRTAIIVCMAAVLGGSTLGVGLGAGMTLSRHYLVPAANTEDSLTTFSFSNESTAVVPVNVHVSTFSEVIKSVSESVVSINVSSTAFGMFGRSQEQQSAGSGIIFASDERNVYIATNNHVIENASEVSISLDDHDNVNANLVGRDAASDLAVISVLKTELDELGVPYKIALFGDSSLMEVGDEVVAIGNSMGEGQIATSGIVSAVNKQITIDGKTLDVIQTDAAINPGNSGGPLANNKGEVIGINTAKLFTTGVEGMGYSIPSNEALKILETLRVDGSIKKPYLGILGPRTIDVETMRLFSLPSTGVLVTDVDEKGAAAKAGIQSRDLIVGYNDITISATEDLLAALTGSQVGDEVTLSLYRGSTSMEVNVVIGSANTD